MLINVEHNYHWHIYNNILVKCEYAQKYQLSKIDIIFSVSTHAIQENTCSYHFIRLENNEYAIHESSSVDHFKYNIYCAIVHWYGVVFKCDMITAVSTILNYLM